MSAKAIEAPVLPDAPPSGYSATDDYVVTASMQGGRTHYSVTLALPQIPQVLPVPDPNETMDDNRAVIVGHAESFATYIRENENWHSGSLTIRAPDSVVEFAPYQRGKLGTTEIGTLHVDRNARDSILVIDGQHRILGIDIAFRRIARELQTAHDKEDIPRVKQLKAQRKRLSEDSINIDLLIENNSTAARQVFVDVAKNARGITSAVNVRFDRRKVVNRALDIAMDDASVHRLIAGRVDEQKDRILGANKNLLSAKHLAEIIRYLEVGISGRIGVRQERDLKEVELAARLNDFLDVLAASFHQLELVADGSMPVQTLRAKSMLASTTMLRVLAGAYFVLSRGSDGLGAMNRSEITAFFENLSMHMGTPVTSATAAGKAWIGTDCVEEGASAPQARRQLTVTLVKAIAGWARSEPLWLKGGATK